MKPITSATESGPDTAPDHGAKTIGRGARVIADRVTRRFADTEVLHEVSFTVEPSELVALTGPSGSGKTTLLQLIGSLDRPTSGRVMVDDVSVGDLNKPAQFRRTTVGFIFQLHHLLPDISIRQNVELPMAAARVPRRERADRALALLADVGLSGRAADLPSALSGGERQRVAIARALANHPRLLLADEPTGSLDMAASHRIWHLLEEVRNRFGTTIIVASHDTTLAEHTDRSLQVLDGHIVDPGGHGPQSRSHPTP